MTSVTLHRGGSYSHAGKQYHKGVPANVSPAIASYLIATGRFTDSGAPPVTVKTGNPNRNFVKLSDSVKEEKDKADLKSSKKKAMEESQKKFSALVDEFKANLPDFGDVKEIRKFAKEEYGLVLCQAKLPALIDELAHALADNETKGETKSEKPVSSKKEVNKKTAMRV